MNAGWWTQLAAWWPQQLAWPWALALLPLPALMLLLPAWQARGDALRVPWAWTTPGTGWRPRLPALATALLWLGWALLCVALARPQQLGPPLAPAAQARQMMLALDLSGSMGEADMQLGGRPVERIVVARAVLDDFLSRRAGDRIGVIVFGQQAHVLTPITADLASVRAQLNDAVVGLAGQETAIGDAVTLAVKRLRQQGQGQRVLVLLTDGVNTAGAVDPAKAAELAARDGVRVHTIAFGGEGGMRLFGLQLPGGGATLDEDTLRRIASSTGGEFFRARDSRELAGIYARIEQLEPVAVAALPLRPTLEHYWPWLAAALLALLLACVARARA